MTIGGAFMTVSGTCKTFGRAFMSVGGTEMCVGGAKERF